MDLENVSFYKFEHNYLRLNQLVLLVTKGYGLCIVHFKISIKMLTCELKFLQENLPSNKNR